MPLPNKRNGPRLDPYQRLISRFYEPLILLRILGKTRGDHVPGARHTGSVSSIRRRFFDNICYICDYLKGGETTSAIGVEERDDCFNFWVASNEESSKIVNFISIILHDVKLITTSRANMRLLKEQRFIHKCVDFAKPRIGKEAKLLSRAIDKCSEYMRQQDRPEGIPAPSYYCQNLFDC